jgi:Leucine-rich repeat (LRR) protein
MTTTAHYQAMIRDGVLDLSGTDISDLAPLAGLTGLHVLYLSGTKVSDLAPLAGLTGLQSLHLSRTKVSGASVAELRRSLPNLTDYR